MLENFRFYSLYMLVWIIPIIFIIIIKVTTLKKYSNILKSYKNLHLFLPNISTHKLSLKFTMIFLGFLFIIIALLRPQGNPKPRINIFKGRDIVFLIDVSKSMLATDVVPNRLEKVKYIIKDFLKAIPGNRIAVIEFAGTYALKAPLTTDYNFINYVIDKLSVYDVNRGGTNIGDAIRYILKNVFKKNNENYQDIVIFTDGGDQESMPVEAAKEAGERNIRIITIGIGSPEGSKIYLPDKKTYLTYKGKPVYSKLNEKLLKEIAAQTPGGVYIPLRTATADYQTLAKKLFASQKKKIIKGKETFMWSELFQPFLLIGILLLISGYLLSAFNPPLGVKENEK